MADASTSSVVDKPWGLLNLRRNEKGRYGHAAWYLDPVIPAPGNAWT